MRKDELTLYHDLLGDLKTRIRHAQRRAALSANAEMILMYWDVGRMIADRQHSEGWGAEVIPRLAADLKNELAEQRQGTAVTNFSRTLPEAHAAIAQALLKDPYLFDFSTIWRSASATFTSIF